MSAPEIPAILFTKVFNIFLSVHMHKQCPYAMAMYCLEIVLYLSLSYITTGCISHWCLPSFQSVSYWIHQSVSVSRVTVFFSLLSTPELSGVASVKHCMFVYLKNSSKMRFYCVAVVSVLVFFRHHFLASILLLIDNYNQTYFAPWNTEQIWSGDV